MKILHLCTRSTGGAGTAARRIVDAERSIGLEASFMTAADFGIDADLRSNGWRDWTRRLGRKLEHLAVAAARSANPVVRSPGWRSFGLVDRINGSDADIVHLHWINDGLLGVRDIPEIRKPLVWTLHDSWAFCGTEHHPDVLEGDTRWKEGYHRGNFPATSSGLDLDRRVWNRKRRLWRELKCKFTAPSAWEAEMFNGSALAAGRWRCVTIPNPLPPTGYSRGDRGLARSRLGIAGGVRWVAFGACDAVNPLKGGDLLVRALERLRESGTEVGLLVVGTGSGAFSGRGFGVHALGAISETEALATVYRAAEAFVCPSRVESFGQMAAESLACGTPVACFDCSGLTDVVEHGVTGYRARPYDPDDLATGIRWCLENSERTSAACSAAALGKFEGKAIAGRFREVYDEAVR